MTSRLLFPPSHLLFRYFVPPLAGANQTPFGTMIESRLASYSGFRYFSEMLSSGFMSDGEATALSRFRESHEGTLSGMTRYTDHLDDMYGNFLSHCFIILELLYTRYTGATRGLTLLA